MNPNWRLIRFDKDKRLFFSFVMLGNSNHRASHRSQLHSADGITTVLYRHVIVNGLAYGKRMSVREEKVVVLST